MVIYDALADFYDSWSSSDPIYLASGEFYRQFCLSAPGILVEIGVGTGRIAIELAKAGRRVIGIDVSDQMLAACRQKAVDHNVSDRLVLCRMDAQKLGLRNIDLIILPFRTLGHFTTYEARHNLFAQVYTSLSHGGCFIFDHYVLDYVWAEAHDGIPRLMCRVLSAEGAHLIWDTYKYDFSAGLMDCVITVEHTDFEGVVVHRRHTSFPFAWVAVEEVRQIAADIGFEVEALYGDFHNAAFSQEASDQVWVLRKAKIRMNRGEAGISDLLRQIP